ncbi:MAG: cytochrome c oxidase cbb3-type subunit 3 [Flammeovirgaceae bacterium]|jgi:cytochrome c oxidase cbb3-type subunit 3
MKPNFRYSRIWLVALFLFLGNESAMAQSNEQFVTGFNNDWVLIGALGAAFITLLLIFIILAGIAFSFTREVAPKTAIVQEEEKEPFWTWFWLKFNSAVPKAKEKDILLNHESDGIRELDNDLPPWWKYGFYLSIVIGIIYMFVYHGGHYDHDVSVREYMAENSEAETRKTAYLARMESMIDETNVEMLVAQSEVDAGKAIYIGNCIACHGALGEGGVGPNLADAYWLHGGGITNIFKTVKYGVQEKGMLAWKEKLTPKQMQQVSSFVMTFGGTTPPNAKEPQGEIYKEESKEKTDEEEKDIALVD